MGTGIHVLYEVGINNERSGDCGRSGDREMADAIHMCMIIRKWPAPRSVSYMQRSPLVPSGPNRITPSM